MTAAQASRTSAAQGANLANAIIIAATATHSQATARTAKATPKDPAVRSAGIISTEVPVLP